jgi:hypothetical protein
MDRMRIGALAERAGTNAPMIRYYEEIGLLRRPDGFPIQQVRSLVALLDDPMRSCMEARDLAREHLRCCPG